ncbi:uncharacterized protein LOC122260897 isoform X2 [Penaeus japonicus]|uniref:uncharacterized protein LOC122260897 isoform X2 n=1 Tax=Penaeus japonicus TaxID=27405 RepID=UPI001C70F0D7|nr:uncharacterized protein LOC122260897 isoform X2 [Penaeus japonicus]XP_042884290.1 uncharacterized protein LOC122260897 isoform X2 [Penaeus japonicus]XP_042884291.1 uncharacterized protein LOC122260897 isoform X2 [Penaeus japonicus]XP_042884292.1 uncharacterized protein LOC122260897 isoform X2 [Penaeus japonicus]
MNSGATLILLILVGLVKRCANSKSAKPPISAESSSVPSSGVTPTPTPFNVSALLVYPPPFPITSYQSGRRKNLTVSGLVENEVTEHVNKEKTVKVFTDDWDDMETCPFWCKDKEGGLFCCGFEGKDKHAGRCPPLEVVCIIESDVKQDANATHCVSDGNCHTKERCCFDRCLQARVCKASVENA